jgi:hypothetical protein
MASINSTKILQPINYSPKKSNQENVQKQSVQSGIISLNLSPQTDNT